MNKIDNKISASSGINGEIELYRFLFCIAVLLFHAEKYFLGEPSSLGAFKPYFFVHGAVGVEFFFVCSGFFMARSLRKDIAKGDADTGSAAVKFILHKIKGIAPVHIVFFILSFISLIIVRAWGIKEIISRAVDSIPSFFLIQMLGFKGTSPNHVSWYLSVMLISMFVIYPFARKWYSVFVKVIAPVLALVILGYLYLNYGSLTGVMVKVGIFYKSMLRGFAEILIGLTVYEIAEWFKAKEKTKAQRVLISVAAVILLIGSGIYIMHTLPSRYEFLMIPVSAALMVIAHSRQGILFDLVNNRFSVLLGKLTLPVYLSQVTMINLIGYFGSEWSFGVQTAVLAVSAFALAGVFLALTNRS
ncbi:MAG: acyltransferase [Clostridiales bacterium]|nr:acyltransferase [Clostridiales bacterium]